MKNFKNQEIRDLLNQVYHEEISFSRMVEILNERVMEAEKPNFKDGDFLHSDWDDEDITIIFKNRVGDHIYYHASKSCYFGVTVSDDRYWRDENDFRIATEEEKQELLDALAKEGKRWNAEKLEIEGIPQCKFKEGDFVYEDERIIIVKSCPNMYHAIIWHTHSYSPNYNGTYAVDFSALTFRYATEDEKQILIDAMRKGGKRWNAEKMCVEDIPEEPKKGDLAIFWDSSKESALVHIYWRKEGPFHYDSAGYSWKNAIKFKSKKQFKKLIKGEI